jgi:hypothetical protein
MSTCPDFPRLSCLLFYHYLQSFEYSKVYDAFLVLTVHCTYIHIQFSQREDVYIAQMWNRFGFILHHQNEHDFDTWLPRGRA